MWIAKKINLGPFDFLIQHECVIHYTTTLHVSFSIIVFTKYLLIAGTVLNALHALTHTLPKEQGCHFQSH